MPLPPEARARIQLSDEWRYAALAEGVEAWGFRFMQDRGEFLTREQVAEAWFREEYVPVVELLREAGLLGRGTEAEAYMRVSALRYLLLRTHAWDDEVVERLRAGARAPAGRGRGHARAPAAHRARPAPRRRDLTPTRPTAELDDDALPRAELDRAVHRLAVARRGRSPIATRPSRPSTVTAASGEVHRDGEAVAAAVGPRAVGRVERRVRARR